MNTIARQEIKHFVFEGGFRPPALTERINQRSRLLNGTAYVVLELITEVVVRPRKAGRQQSHLQPIEKIASDVIKRLGPGLAFQ